MKNFLPLFAMISLFIFTACNNQKIEDDFVPVDEESLLLPTNYKTDNTINAGIVNFSINNEDKTVFEKDDLILSNNSVNAVSYLWDFGNGETSTDALPSYKYELHGNYTVT